MHRNLDYHGRVIQDWVQEFDTGNLKLPKFQRSYVWKTPKISDFLESVLKDRPLGALLLIPDDPDKFPSRLFQGISDAANPQNKALVLDGQQRLTSLRRALRGDVKFYVQVKDWNKDIFEINKILTPKDVPGRKSAAELYKKLCFPFEFLGNSSTSNLNDGQSWCKAAVVEHDIDPKDLWKKINTNCGKRLQKKKLWYLTLPASMTREEAIDVYIKTNESSAVINKLDIAVALYDQGHKERSLRDDIRGVFDRRRQLIERFFELDIQQDGEKFVPQLGTHLIKVACLWSGTNGLVPTEGNYNKTCVLSTLEKKRKELGDAFQWALDFYTREGILRKQFIPSDVPLRVLPALHPVFKKIPAKHKPLAIRLIRAYLWRAFLTNRYDRSASTRLYEDYCQLKIVFSKGLNELHRRNDFDMSKIPCAIFECDLPSKDMFCKLDKPLPGPKSSKFSRAVFAICVSQAFDIGTGEKLDYAAVEECEHHHIFPKSILEGAGLDQKKINHCLNYMLLKPETHRAIGNSPPWDYAASSAQLAKLAGGSKELEKYFKSHYIPFKNLIRKPKNYDVEDAYQEFIESRGKLVFGVIRKLMHGKVP